MTRSIPWFWLVLIALLLLFPAGVGRLLLDLIGGLTLLLLLLPLLGGIAAFIGWRILRSRLITCPACGLTSFGQDTCPACGTPLSSSDSASAASGPSMDREIDASTATVTVTAVDVVSRSEGS